MRNNNGSSSSQTKLVLILFFPLFFLSFFSLSVFVFQWHHWFILPSVADLPFSLPFPSLPYPCLSQWVLMYSIHYNSLLLSSYSPVSLTFLRTPFLPPDRSHSPLLISLTPFHCHSSVLVVLIPPFPPSHSFSRHSNHDFTLQQFNPFVQRRFDENEGKRTES